MLKLIKKDGRRKMISVAAACALLVSGVTYFQMDHSIVVSASSGEYRTWKQSDSRWSGTCLGRSGETMSQSGCAVTSLAMLVVHAGYFDESTFTPGTLCTFLNNNGGLDGSGNIYWGVVSKLIPDFTFEGTAYLYGSTEAEKASEIKSYLDQGYYLVSDVKYSSHWVAIDSVSDGVVYSFDPARNTTNNLFDQYNFRGTTRLKLFKSAGSSKPSAPQENVTNTTFETGTYITTSKLNVRTDPSASASKIDLLDLNAKVQVTETSGNWGKITINNKTGWICLNYTSMIGNQDIPSVTYSTGTYITNDVLNYRKQPNKSSESDGLIPNGTKLPVLEVSGNWGKTVYNGKTSWICLEYTEFVNNTIVTESPVIQPSVTQPSVSESVQKKLYITNDVLNLRTGAGTNNTVISLIPADTQIFVSEISGNWGKINLNNSEGWICLDFAEPADNSNEVVTIPAVAAPAETPAPAPVPSETAAPAVTAPAETSAAPAPVPSETVAPAVTAPVETSAAPAPVPSETAAPAVTAPVETSAAPAPSPPETVAPVVTAPAETPESPVIKIVGDVNNDGKINAVDMIALINIMLSDGSDTDSSSADINGDLILSALDLVSLKFILLSY